MTSIIITAQSLRKGFLPIPHIKAPIPAAELIMHHNK
jgi:hypothetical protein